MAAFSYNYLPGVQVTTIDGGLVARRVPTSKAVLVLGTSAIGPANQPYPVSDQPTAVQLFGLAGSLSRGMSEVAYGGADNIILFRIGTSPATLANVGVQVGSLATPGFIISFGSVDATVGTDYSIWYNGAGVLYVWNGTQLVFSSNPSDPVDTGDLTINGQGANAGLEGIQAVTGQGGITLGSQSGGASLMNAIPVFDGTHTCAAYLIDLAVPFTAIYSYWLQSTSTSNFVPACTGTNLTGRQIYIALAEAMELLDIYPVDEVVAPDAIFDNPTVAFYVPGNAATYVNNPVTNPNALDWLLVTTDSYGHTVYHWATESYDSEGNPVAPVTFTSYSGTGPTARGTTDYGEVNFGHALAIFAQKQEVVGMAGTCVVFIGTSQPYSYSLIDLRKWVGYLPTYDPTVVDQLGNADVKVEDDGSGLLGNPFLAGCTGAKLNPASQVNEYGGRSAGLFKTTNGLYDGEAEIDANGNLVDVGAYIHIMADVGIMFNSYKNGYAWNLANYTGGYCATLDEKVNLTNKPVMPTQLWKPNSIQLDAATDIGVNFLRFKGNGNLPTFTHGQTAATNASDYKNLLRQRIKGLVTDAVRVTADPFLGSSSIDGLQVQAMQTALNNKMMTLQKRGYVSRFSFTVTTTPAQQRIGHATINITFNPADELIQLQATVAVSRS